MKKKNGVLHEYWNLKASDRVVRLSSPRSTEKSLVTYVTDLLHAVSISNVKSVACEYI